MGPSAGTAFVTRLRGDTTAANLTVIDGSLYFTGLGVPSPAPQVFKTDGTAAGTVALTSFSFSGTVESNLTSVAGRLFFRVAPGTGHDELWSSDGTAAGTAAVTPPAPFTSGSLSHLTAVGTTLYFAAGDATHGTELWKSDGTSGGTVLVKDISSGPGSTQFGAFAAAGGFLYFVANGALWKSDGSAAGTVSISPAQLSGVSGLTVDFGQLFFSGTDSTAGTELWKTNGTLAGTVRVKDIKPGTASSNPASLVVAGGELFFTADDGSHGVEVWKSDGTADGTVLVADVSPGPPHPRPPPSLPLARNCSSSPTTVGTGRAFG